MYIINTRKLGSTRTMTICKPEYPLEMYCDGIWNVGNLEILEIKVYITGEEMQPDKRVQLSSRDELLGVISSGAKIAYCGFKCIYRDYYEFAIVVDYERKKLRITCDNGDVSQVYNLIEEVKTILG